MDILSRAWDFFWLLVGVYAIFAFLTLLVSLIGDLFRDRSLSGWAKASWLVFLVLVPVLSALVYLVVRGDGMAARSERAVDDRREALERHIRSVTGASLSDEITRARILRDAGTIDASEFELIKQRTLAR